MIALKLSPWQTHVQRWINCTRCPYHRGRQNVVLARGSLPCDVLLIGEGPGASEDCTGEPFAKNAPAGNLLQRIVDAALPNGIWAMTNVVACVPNDDGVKIGAPGHDECRACAPRLQELVNLADPRLVVAVGDEAATWLDQGLKHRSVTFKRGVRLIWIEHPSHMLRKNEMMKKLAADRAAVQIMTAWEDLDAR